MLGTVQKLVAGSKRKGYFHFYLFIFLTPDLCFILTLPYDKISSWGFGGYCENYYSIYILKFKAEFAILHFLCLF